METLIGNMNSVFLDRGIDADMAICPADVSAVLRCRQETRDFMLNGALAQLYQYVSLWFGLDWLARFAANLAVLTSG